MPARSGTTPISCSSEQLARGLYGVLVVEEREPVEVDRDLMLVVDDWRLMDDGAIQPSFGNFHDAMMAGRLGQYITLNSQDTLQPPREDQRAAAAAHRQHRQFPDLPVAHRQARRCA